MSNENEAIALATFFGECGVNTTIKGNVVKANGEPSLVQHLYDIFIVNVLV